MVKNKSTAHVTAATLRQLRRRAAAVLAVIEDRKLEGATYISPKSALADQCRDELEEAEHYLSHTLCGLPRCPRHRGDIPMLLDAPLPVEQLGRAQAAVGLLDDASMNLFSESGERRRHFGTIAVAPRVCQQLREAIALLGSKSKQDNGKETENKWPLNPDVKKLCTHLKTHQSEFGTLIGCVRDFLQKRGKDTRKAEGLLRQANRFPHQWRT